MLLSLNAIALSGVMIAASSLFMASLMFSVGKDRVSRVWGFFCVAVFIWGGSFYFIASTQDSNLALAWWKISHIGVILIPALFLYFVYLFLKEKRPKTLSLLFVLSAFFLVADIATNTLVAHTRYVFGEFFYNSPGGVLYPAFFVYFQSVIIYGHYLLFQAYRTARNSVAREQIKHFFMATLVGFLGGSVSFAPVFGVDIYPVAIVTVTLYPIIMGYAILRFNLFNVRVVVAQILAAVIFGFTFVNLFNSDGWKNVVLNTAILGVALVLGTSLARSIAEEVEQRELIERQEKELEAANAKQKALLHFISHEIKSYLARSEAVFASIVEGDFGEVQPKLGELSKTALADIRAGVATMMDILDVPNLKQGTIVFKKLPFDFRALVLRIVEEQRPAAYEKHLGFDVRVADGVYRMIGDEEKLRQQVIRNLIDNAIRYTPSGSIRIELSDGGGKIRFVIQDSGVGITPEDMTHLFTEGGHGKDSIKVNVHSTGYGLFIAKEVVDAHGGKIWGESEGLGKGSRFTVEFTAGGA